MGCTVYQFLQNTCLAHQATEIVGSGCCRSKIRMRWVSVILSKITPLPSMTSSPRFLRTPSLLQHLLIC
ncbi:unnamed protein product [Sphagnum troendelagicum]|uniref:Uncharacterized protein n=1 Tax=Sphagnum troendelagicum TaxID=128251 RepID=A0ABP0UZE2_9BRYO